MSTIIQDDDQSWRQDGPVRTELAVRSAASDVATPTYIMNDGSLAEPSEKSGLNASIVVHSLRRNWLLGSLLGIFAAAPLVFAAWSLMKLEFKATALVRISPQHVPLLFETADRPGGAAGRPDFKSYKNTQRQLLLSPQLLNNALKKEGISSLGIVQGLVDPIAWLQKELVITFPDDAEIMHVSMKSTDGKVAQKLIDAIVNTYYEEVVVADQNDRLKRVDSLERVQTEAENKARAERAELRNLVELLGTGDSSTLNLTQQAAVQQYSLIRTELTKIQFELMRVEGEVQFRSQNQQKSSETAGEDNRLAQAKFNPAESGSPPVADDLLPVPAGSTSKTSSTAASDPRVKQLLESDPIGVRHTQEVDRYSNLIQLADKRLHPRAAATIVGKYREQLGEAQRKVSERTQALQEMLPMNGGTRSLAGDDLPREIEILKAQERRLQEELKRQEAEGKKIGRSSIDVDMMRSEVEGLDKVVGRITDELERTKIELKSNSRITILGSAQVPQVGESKKRLLVTGAAGIFGLLGPLVLLMGIDLRRQLVNGRKTMGDMMIPVLGSLPMVPRRIMQRMGNVQDGGASIWRRRLAESIAAVTSLLLHKLELEGHRVILITSGTPGEGKSTLAEQLANSLADSGHRTLLIDFDLRRPTMHDRFAARLEPGVTEVLRSGADLKHAVFQAESPNLSILTAGNCPGSLLQDAANGSLQSLFDQRANYEIVIVDSCPLLPVMDGRLIGRYTDGAILSVIKDVSQVPDITTARDIMRDYGIPSLGCVVTGDSGDSYYGSYIRENKEEPAAV